MNGQTVKFLTVGSKCPSCTTHLLVHHCDSRNCLWLRCMNVHRCNGLFDVATGRYSVKERV